MALKFAYGAVQRAAYPTATNLRISSISVQYVAYQSTLPQLRSTIALTQLAQYQSSPPALRATMFLVQVIQRAPEVNMSTLVYPQLIGLTYPIGMKPVYNTKQDVHTSGRQTNTSFWENAKWDFTLQYDYLPNQSSQQSTDFTNLLGFFCAMRGAWDTFLFKCPDFNHVEKYILATGDGSNTQTVFDLSRPIGDYFVEPIGQLNDGTLSVVIQRDAEPHTVPASPGPYTVVLNNITGVTISKVSKTPTGDVYAQVPAPPGPGQYSFDPATGTLTFNAAQQGTNILVQYQFEAVAGTDYNFTMPRNLVLATTLKQNDLLITTFDYYFVCTFADDEGMDPDTFMSNLYELGSITLRSQII